VTQYRINQFAVGLFVLAGLVTLFLMLAMLTGRTGPTHSYFTVLNNVAGVQYGTQVVYEGYPIGQVQNIEPEPGDEGLQFRLELAVDRNWQIPDDSVTVVSSPSVLSAKTILIRGGKSQNYFEPGDTLPAIGSASMFGALQDMARTFADLSSNGLFPLITNLNNQITKAGDLLSGDLQALVANLRETSGELQTQTPDILNNVQAFSRDLAAAGKNIDRALNEDNLAAIDRILANADQTSARLAGISQDIRTVVTDLGPNIDASGKDLRFSLETVARHIDSLTHNLDAASLQLLEFSRQIRNNPSVIIRGTEPGSGEEIRGPNE